MDPRIKLDLETVHPPPPRPDAALQGRTVKEATAEAHEREARNEEATEHELVEKKVAAMPSDDGQGGSWQLREEKVGDV